MTLKTGPVLFYVDDDEDDLMIFGDAAKELGVVVRLFNSGEKLLEALESPDIEPSIVFVDLNMPGKSGYDVISEIRSSSRWNKLPAVVLSTASDNFSIQKSRLSGASLYMQKFTDPDKLVAAIKDAMGRDWSEFTDEAFVYAA
jgi:CheY-like chemotaxis protein